MNTDVRNVAFPCSWVPAFAGTTEMEMQDAGCVSPVADWKAD
jgi:hypothetical protein